MSGEFWNGFLAGSLFGVFIYWALLILLMLFARLHAARKQGREG